MATSPGVDETNGGDSPDAEGYVTVLNGEGSLSKESTADLPQQSELIQIRGARAHNLKNVSLDIPRNELVVLTGPSGSGKSSLAFDTLFAEGQRQFIESLSMYARQFLHQMERPDVDLIEGLQPTLCIDQRPANQNPRSTVATVTEIYDYLRLMMARLGTPHCPDCGESIQQQTTEQIQERLLELPEGTKAMILAPLVRGRRGQHQEVFSQIRKAGLVRTRVDGDVYELDNAPELEARKLHHIDAVVDRIIIREGIDARLAESIQMAVRLGSGVMSVCYHLGDTSGNGPQENNGWQDYLYSTIYACPNCNVSFEELEPRTFSFNSPYGACPGCDGMGTTFQFSESTVVGTWESTSRASQFEIVRNSEGATKRRLGKTIRNEINSQGIEPDDLKSLSRSKRKQLVFGNEQSPGILRELASFYEVSSEQDQQWLDDYRERLPCPTCNGARLRPEALAVTLNGKSIAAITAMSIGEALPWLEAISFGGDKEPIARPILNEMLHRFRFLNKVGVHYLSLDRSADTLSGGELQRVRLATCIGSGLVGVCYILDEPSIGLHQRDNDRLIESLRDLQSAGNTVLVVEHDESMMRAADLLVDIGPGAGTEGGEIVASGPPEAVEAHPTSLTAMYLRQERVVGDTTSRRQPRKTVALRLRGAALHNLKKVDLDVPLGLLVGVTGVSGSGKSSLIGQTLIPALALELGQRQGHPGSFKSLGGTKHVDKLVEITQAPIGRTPRSTPATYCGVFDLIRGVWATTREAKQRGFTTSRFSFNAGTGRCKQCQGQGQEKIEMNFLPDLYVPCSVCGGKRYNRQTLDVRYRDRSIADVLEMSVDQALQFFENFSKITRLLQSLHDVGLGYLRLGQGSTTLSGGESQRIKLATELARPETGQTIYFLDEPTTGLHFEDVRRLVKVLDALVERGNSVLGIEHNLDVIKSCEWIIDIGPEGGSAGGEIVTCGSPEAISQCKNSLTGRYLAELI